MKRRIATSNAAGAVKKTCKAVAATAAFVLTEEYKAHVCAHAYLGQKGYTIPKAVLDPADLEQVCRELFVQPVVHYQPGMPTSGDELAFRVYRDNPNKIYVPRFYGLERYGVPTTSRRKKVVYPKGTTLTCPLPKRCAITKNPLSKHIWTTSPKNATKDAAVASWRCRVRRAKLSWPSTLFPS